MRSRLNSPVFSALSLSILAATAAAAIYLLAMGRWVGATVLAGFILLAVFFIAQRDRLPAMFSFLFVTAGLANAAGYVFDLWQMPVWFDEAVHFFTSFTVLTAFGWLLFNRTNMNAAAHAVKFVLVVAGAGVVLGILWEAFEWIIGIIGSPADTLVDIVMDTFGSIAAGLLCAWAAAKERRGAASPPPIR